MTGTVIGNFELKQLLGKGGMGEVWMAEHQSVGTKAAIKLLRTDISADASLVERFFNEARAVSRIPHAGIVKIFDAGYTGTQAYLVMEFLDGKTLTRRISLARRLPLREVCDLGRQIAGVLGATHAAGIIHRDLKPDNVFLVEDAELPSGERAKLLDFGIAKLASAGITSTSVSSMGTPLYMSPEQWRSAAKVDGRTDAYSLGCVIFEMACGRPPFLADSMGEACAKHLTEAPPAPSSIVPGLPPAFDALVGRLLDKEAAGRPGMKEVMAALDAIAAALPAAADRSGARLPSSPVPLTAATISTLPGVAATSAGRAGGLTGGPPPTLPPHAISQPAVPYPPQQAQGVPHGAQHGSAHGSVHGSPHAVYPPHTAPPPMGQTTLGGAAGTASGTGAGRGRRVGWIAGGALVAGAAAAAIAVSAGGGGGAGSGSQVAAISPAPDAAPDAVSPPPPPIDAAGPEDAPADAVPDEPPTPRGDAVLVEAAAMKRIFGETPKGLHAQVPAYFCVDAAGEVTSIEVSVNLDRKVAEEVIDTLERWRYAPYARNGIPIAVCFPTQIGPRPATPPKPPGPGSGKPPGAGSGSGSGSGKPPGPGSGKPPGPGSGKPPGPGSGSGKPPGPGSGSGAPPILPEALALAEVQAAVTQRAEPIRKCRTRAHASGTLTAHMVIAPRGNVQSVAITDVPGTNLTSCVRRIVQSIRFPATKRGGTFDIELPQ